MVAIHLLLVFSILFLDPCNALQWPWSTSPPLSSTKPPLDRPHESSPYNPSVFESDSEEAFSSNSRSLIQQGQRMMVDSREGTLKSSCWHKAYKQLLSGCREILRDEEKKARLAYELTECFLKMTGWPVPAKPCRKNQLTKTCTEKLDKHTHALYLAFFVETASMCHHLQSEAFKAETEQAVNELKESAHWLVDKLHDADLQAQEIAGQLKGIESTSHAISEHSEQIRSMQIKQQEEHAIMNKALNEGMKELQEVANETHQQLHGIAQVQRQIAEEHRKLADAALAQLGILHQTAIDISSSTAQSLRNNDRLLNGYQHLREEQGDVLHGLSELKELQDSAMEETTSALSNLAEEQRRRRLELENWQLKMKQSHAQLESNFQEILGAQAKFMSNQGAIFTTLDRLFDLYNSILHESRVLKLTFFYGSSLFFVHILTSAKQTNRARALLYAGLCMSMGVELCAIWWHGKLMANRQWIQSQAYWMRRAFGAFTAVVFTYCLATYRDIELWNNKLLLDLHQKLSQQSLFFTTTEASQFNSSSARWAQNQNEVTKLISLVPKSQSQTPTRAMATKILHRVHKFFEGKRRNKITSMSSIPQGDDPLKRWMDFRGFDVTMLDETDSSDEDPDFVPPGGEAITRPPYRRYSLRSACQRFAKAHNNHVHNLDLKCKAYLVQQAA